MNLREFWAAEAAKLRDTSEILGVPNLSETVTNLNKVIEDTSVGYESVTVCVVPNGWRTDFVNLASANRTRTSADIADIAAITNVAKRAEWVFDLFVEADDSVNMIQILKQKLGGTKKIGFLVIVSHGNYEKAFFEIGAKDFTNAGDQYVTTSDINKDGAFKTLATMLHDDSRIVFTACHLGSPQNNGQKLVLALCKILKKTIYANQSWCTSTGSKSNQALFRDSRYNQQLPVVQNWPLNVPNITERYKIRNSQTYAVPYRLAGNWSQCFYNNGNPIIKIIHDVSFKTNGIQYYHEPQPK